MYRTQPIFISFSGAMLHPSFEKQNGFCNFFRQSHCTVIITCFFSSSLHVSHNEDGKRYLSISARFPVFVSVESEVIRLMIIVFFWSSVSPMPFTLGVGFASSVCRCRFSIYLTWVCNPYLKVAPHQVSLGVHLDVPYIFLVGLHLFPIIVQLFTTFDRRPTV